MPGYVWDLLIITPQVIVALSILAGLSAILAVHRWRRRRGGGVAATLLALLLLAALVGDSVNAHYQYLPRVADVVNIPTWPTASASIVLATAAVPSTTTATSERSSGNVARYPRGAVIKVDLPGVRSHFGTHRALVYLPPEYFTEPRRRFPVVYLVHGSPGAPVDWFRAARAAEAGLSAARAGHPVLLVAPRASRSWSDDSECVDSRREHVETYLSDDVPHAIDRILRTLPGRAHRAIAGNSAGGFCALNIGLRHRATFGALLDLSGFDHPTYSGGLAELYGSRSHLSRAVAADTPAAYLPGMPIGPRMHVWLDYGRADSEPRRDERRLARLLVARGEDVIVRSRPGGHDYGVWRPALRESVLWAAALLAPGPG